MVPSSLTPISALPKNSSFKVDRGALPKPDGSRPQLESALVEPRNELEQRIAMAWTEVLQISPVGVRDDFFDLGGDSLLAIQVALEIESVTGRAVALDVLLHHPTVEALADHLRGGLAVAVPVTALQPAGQRRPSCRSCGPSSPQDPMHLEAAAREPWSPSSSLCCFRPKVRRSMCLRSGKCALPL